MNIHYEYHEVAGSQRLESLLAEKLEKLEHKYDFITSADVYFKKGKTNSPESDKICSVRLSIPGPTLFAESSAPTFEASIAKVVTELRSQLQKRKEKIKSH